MAEELMEVISGASHGSYSFVHENFIYRINKFTNKRVYLSCRLSYCRGAGKGVKGASRGEVYNFKLTKSHNHPAEEHKIRLFEVKQYVRDQARLTQDSSKEIYERAVQQFNCYDISRACVEGLVKRSRERNNPGVKSRRRKWAPMKGESSSESEEVNRKRRHVTQIPSGYEEAPQDVPLEVYEEELYDDVGEAAVVEIIQSQEIKAEELGDKVPAGIIVATDDNSVIEFENETVAACSDLSCDVYTRGSDYSDSEPESSESSDDLDECPPSELSGGSLPGPSHNLLSRRLQSAHQYKPPSRILCSKRPVSETEDDEVFENQDSLEETLLKIYSTSYFRSKENVFKLLSNAQETSDNEEGAHSVNSSNTLKVIKSAFKLCRFANVKASQLSKLLLDRTNELNELEDILTEHLSSLMCFSGTQFFQKCFGQSLREAIESGKTSDTKNKHAWSEEEIIERGSDKRMQLAVALQCYSGRAYSALGELVDLPGPHITRKWATNFQGYPGFTGQSYAFIREEVIRLKEKTIHVCLTMEDLPLRKSIKWEDAHITGFTDLGFGRVESDSIPEATRAVIFYANALNSSWKLPVGYCFADHLSAQVRANLLCQYVSKLEFCGVKCIGIVLNDSVTTHQIYDEFGVFVKGALPQGSFHTNADEKVRVSPFVDTIELMQSVKFLLKEKKLFVTPTGVEIMWCHIQYAEELFESESTDWVALSGSSSSHFINYLKFFLREKLRKDKWPFGKHLLAAMKILRIMGVSEFVNAGPSISFVHQMVTITEVFSCPNKFLENRLVLPNNKDTFAIVNKWIHYIGNMKFSCGQFVRDSDRKMPLMNLCMNLSSLKMVVRRTFDSSRDELFNRFSLDNVKNFISQMGFGQDTRMPTPSQFKDEYFRLINSINKSLLSNTTFNCGRSKECKPRQEIYSTFYVTKTYIYSPFYSMCDCVEDFFLEKVINDWMDLNRCVECYDIMLKSMQNFSPINPGLYKNLRSMFRIAERCLCLMGELPVGLTEPGCDFDAYANSVLTCMVGFDCFKLHGHLFNSVEYGETCHFTDMVKDMLRIYLRLRLLYLSREVNIGIHDFQDSSLKYSVGHYWA